MSRTARLESERFWSKVQMDNHLNCWPWIGGCNVVGYGRFSVERNESWRIILAHRWSFEYFNGAIPEGLRILHRCDVPSCVNPSHLFLGTQQDNMKDMKMKDRQHTGERSGAGNKRKFAPDQVRAIRADTRTHLEIAKDYGVSKGTITHIKLRYNYAWVE